MTHNTPVLTIVMPIYNHPAEVSIMIDSVIANQYQDWELLLIDDGSEPETLNMLRTYTQSDPRIQLITRQRLPKGAQTCRNIGLEQAKGRFIVFFDSDDRVTPTCLGQRIEAMLANPQYDFLVFPSAVIQNGETITEPHHQSFGYPMGGDDLARFAKRFLPFIVWSNIYQTQYLRHHNITWDEKILSLQDSDFNITVLLSGARYTYILTAPDYYYRIKYSPTTVSAHISDPSHQNSHLYTLRKNYLSYQSHFGHRYDFSLYIGTLFLINRVCADIPQPQFLNKIKNIVCHYSTLYGFLLALQICTLNFLRHILPYRFARLGILEPYYLYRTLLTKSKLKHIKKQQQP